MQDGSADLGELIRQHERALYGFFRSRLGDDSIVADLVNDTWVEVVARGESFDSERGAFWTFVRIWADIVLRRHWAARGHDRLRPLQLELPANEDAQSEMRDPPDASRLDAADAASVSRALLGVLRSVFSCPRPPNEIIVFGFTKLEWKPREITMSLADTPLNELAHRLEHDCLEVIPSPSVSGVFEPLREKLGQSLHDLLSDPRSRRAYAHVPRGATGAIKLGGYFPPETSPEVAVTQWWNSVKRSAFQRLEAEGFFEGEHDSSTVSARGNFKGGHR